MWTGNGGWEACVMLFFAYSLDKYENNKNPNGLLEPEKKTALNETTLIGIQRVFVDLL